MCDIILEKDKNLTIEFYGKKHLSKLCKFGVLLINNEDIEVNIGLFYREYYRLFELSQIIIENIVDDMKYIKNFVVENSDEIVKKELLPLNYLV
jgi:hypothetical protein